MAPPTGVHIHTATHLPQAYFTYIFRFKTRGRLESKGYQNMDVCLGGPSFLVCVMDALWWSGSIW